MKKLDFPAQEYTPRLVNNKEFYIYNRTEDSVVGMLELLWGAIFKSDLKDLTRAQHKTNKSLKNKIREITRFKDPDNDSRIAKPGPQVLFLEESELDLLKKHLDQGNKFSSAASEDVTALWEVIESAQDFDLKKDIKLVEREKTPSEG